MKLVSTLYSSWMMLISAFLFVLLTGCQTTPETQQKAVPPELKNHPEDVMVDGEDIVDLQLTLADRNLYQTEQRKIKLLDTSQCPLEVSAHRGDFREAENSISTITRATTENFNAIEIDVMLLRDGRWVNHHDLYTGRVTVHKTGKRYNIENIASTRFAELRLRDKETGDLLPYRPITAVEAFEAFGITRKHNQLLNVEVKSKAQRKDLAYLDHLLKKNLGSGAYYYSSSNLDTLVSLRELNSTVYLGLIQQAQPASVAQLRKDIRKGVKQDAYYRFYKEEIERAANLGTRYYRKQKFKDYRSAAGLREIPAKLGDNAGLHLDIRGYAENPSIKGLARKNNLKLYTYSINGTEYHQSQLVNIKKAWLPDGVIVDATPYKICQRLFSTANPKKQYQPVSAIGRYVSQLPADANFERFPEMLGYLTEGYYITLTGKLRKIHDSPDAKKVGQPESFRFPVIKDESIKKSNIRAIIIKLPNN